MHTNQSFWCLLQLNDNLISLFSLPLSILIEIQLHKTKSNLKTSVWSKRTTRSTTTIRSYWYSRHQYKLQNSTQFPTSYNDWNTTENVVIKKFQRKAVKAHCQSLLNYSVSTRSMRKTGNKGILILIPNLDVSSIMAFWI